MGVKVKQLAMVGGGGQFAYFADSLLSADQPFWAGDNWTMAFFNADTTTNGSNGQAQINRSGGTGLQYDGFGVGTGPKWWIFPARFNGAFCWGRTQFVQFTHVSANLAVAANGFASAAMASMNGSQGYNLRVQTPGGGGSALWVLGRQNNSTFNVLLGAGVNVAPGDVLRMEIVPIVATSHVTINIFQNGTLAGTFDDSGAGVIVNTGIPGLCNQGGQPGSNHKISNFSCGSLPQKRTDVNFP